IANVSSSAPNSRIGSLAMPQCTCDGSWGISGVRAADRFGGPSVGDAGGEGPLATGRGGGPASAGRGGGLAGSFAGASGRLAGPNGDDEELILRKNETGSSQVPHGFARSRMAANL